MRDAKKQAKKGPSEDIRLYRFQFPAEDASWYVMKSGSIKASSKAAARRELVKRGVLEPFEAKVARIAPAEK